MSTLKVNTITAVNGGTPSIPGFSGGGGSSGTPVPQKVAYLRDEKPSGTGGGSAVAGWQDRTLNTKDDANNLVVLSNDKEFTLSAGEYQIEWNALAYRINNHQTKLTNVTDGTTQEMGSSEFTGSSNSYATTGSFGSTRVKITTDTTYKIEHYCAIARSGSGLGADSTSGDPNIYTQVTITDLAIVGGTGTAANTNIYGTAKAWANTGYTGDLLKGTNLSVVATNESAGRYQYTFLSPLKDGNYSVVASSNSGSQQKVSAYIYSKTSSGFFLQTFIGSSGQAAAHSVVVHDNEPAEVALTTFGDVINYSGPSAWGSISSDGSLLGGLNVSSSFVSQGNYSVVFTTPMPDANYSVTTGGLGGNNQVSGKTANGFTLTTSDNNGAAQNFGGYFAVFATNALPPKGGTGADAWVTSSGEGFNIASVTQTGGNGNNFVVVFTTPMPSDDYSVVATPITTSDGTCFIRDRTAIGFTVVTRDYDGTTKALGWGAVVHATNATLPTTFTEAQIQSVIDAQPQGIAKAWVNFNGTGTVAIRDSFNVSSITDNGDGDYTVNYTTIMPNTNYVPVFTNIARANQTAGNSPPGLRSPGDSENPFGSITVSGLRMIHRPAGVNQNSNMYGVVVFSS